MAGVDVLLTEITARLGNRTDIAIRALQWLNDAYFELLMAPRFSFYELDLAASTVTIAGTASYSLPADFWFVLDLTDTTNTKKLHRGHWQEFDRQTSTSGAPTRYARFGATFQLDPTPDAVYTLTLRYRKRPAELVAGNATLLGREWDEPLIVLATIKGFEALENREKAATQRALLEPLLTMREDVPELEDMDSETTIAVRMEGTM
jgi:hypothetical protein